MQKLRLDDPGGLQTVLMIHLNSKKWAVFLKLRSTPNVCYLFDVGHFAAHIYKQHFLDEPSKVMFVIFRSYWSKLKIDFILIPSAFLSSPGEPYFFIKASSITSQKECTCPQITAVDTVGVSSRSALSSFSCSSAHERGESSVQDYQIVISFISLIPFVMDILLGWKFSSIFKVKNIFSSHLETI